MPEARLTALLGDARRAVQAAPDDLWPGFSPAEIPLLVFDGQTTSLSGTPPQEPGWTKREGEWAWPGRHPALIANTAVTLPGGLVAAGVLAEGLNALEARRLAALLVHEAFHVFQAARPSPAWEADELGALTYPRATLKVAHARAEESASLAAALAPSAPAHPQDGQEAARAALAWRAVRFRSLSPEHALYERRMETLEGLAHFVETRFLNETPQLDGVRDAGAGVREWAYRSGAALAHLLARGAQGWQAQVMAGVPLDTLLAARVPPLKRPEANPELLRAARLATQQAATESATRLTEFRHLPGPRLILQTEVPWRVRGFDPLNLHALADGSWLHRRYLRVSGSGGELEMTGVSALAHGPDALSVSRLEVAGLPAPLEPAVSGGRWQLGGELLKVNVPAGGVCGDGRGGWRLRSGN